MIGSDTTAACFKIGMDNGLRFRFSAVGWPSREEKSSVILLPNFIGGETRAFYDSSPVSSRIVVQYECGWNGVAGAACPVVGCGILGLCSPFSIPSQTAALHLSPSFGNVQGHRRCCEHHDSNIHAVSPHAQAPGSRSLHKWKWHGITRTASRASVGVRDSCVGAVVADRSWHGS